MKARTREDSWGKSKPSGWLWQSAGSNQVRDGSAEAPAWGEQARKWSTENWALCKKIKAAKGQYNPASHLTKLWNWSY